MGRGGAVPVLRVGHSEDDLRGMIEVLDLIAREDHVPAPLDDVLADLRAWATSKFEGGGSDPDFDILPMFHFEGRGGAVPLVAGFADDDEKEFVFERVAPAAINGVRAELWAVVQSMWRAAVGPDDPDPDDPAFVQPRDRPDRAEVVRVHGCDLDRYVAWHAPVDRTERGVRLGAWEKEDDIPWLDAGGLLVEAQNQALVYGKLAYTSRRMLFDGEAPDGFWTPERREAMARVNERLDGVTSRAETEALAQESGSPELFDALGIFERRPDGSRRPSAWLLKAADLEELEEMFAS